MGLIHLIKSFGLTIRESANDGSDFSNPDADYRILFLGEDGNLYTRDSAGTVAQVGGASGSVATDAIWDAAGDLAVGSGADTAAKLTMGSALQHLRVNAGATALEYADPPSGGGEFTESSKVRIATGDLTTTSTSFVDATGLTITITTAAVRCLVSFSGMIRNNGAGGTFIDLAVDGTRQGETLGLTGNAGVVSNGSFFFLTDVLTAASHTFKIQWRVDAGTGTIYASTGVAPAILTVLETSIAA